MSYTGKGLIIYCDGGNFKRNPGPVGSGLYYYTFSNEEAEKVFPIKGIRPTSKGFTDIKMQKVKEYPNVGNLDEFVKSVLDDESFYDVKITNMVEWCKGTGTIGSNNVGELLAFQQALKTINQEHPDVCIIFTDSEYIIKGMGWLDKWKSTDFITGSGKPINNKEIWEEIYKERNILRANKIPYSIKWIKGHGDNIKDSRTISNISNMFADNCASIGASLSNNKLYFPDTLDEVYREVTIEELKIDKKPEPIHPLLVNKRLYFSFGGRTDKNLFYVGNPGYQVEDIYIGKQIPDAQIGIVYMKDRNPVIEMVEEEQNKWLNQHYGYNNLMYCLMLDNIANTKTYRKLAKYGNIFISRPQGVPNLETVDGSTLTYVNDPVYLGMKNIDNISALQNVLDLYKDNSHLVKAIDLTDVFYSTKEIEVVEDLQGNNIKTAVGKALLKEHTNTMKSIKIPIEFGGDEFVKEKQVKNIILTCGIDMPRRNQMKYFEQEYPSVKLLVWHTSCALYRFAFLVTLHEKLSEEKLTIKNYGIWEGVGVSQILLD